MRKLIAVLEADTECIEVMKDWLSDRLYMYDLFIKADLQDLFAVIRPRFEDVLVLCLSLDLMAETASTIADLEHGFADLISGETPQFPILLHAQDGLSMERISVPLHGWGWRVASVVSSGGTRWIGNDWYPALKKAITDSGRHELVSAADLPD